MGELQKKAKTFNDIRHDLPKIVRDKGDKKLQETIDKHIHAEYEVLYVPLETVEEMRKEAPKKYDYVTGTYVFGETTFHGKDSYEKAWEDWFVKWLADE